MRSNVPGVHIPDAIIKRIEGAEDQKKEGKQLCIDIINEVKEDLRACPASTSWPIARKNMLLEMVHDPGVLTGRQPWKREVNPGDAAIAERFGTSSRRQRREPAGNGRSRRPPSTASDALISRAIGGGAYRL